MSGKQQPSKKAKKEKLDKAIEDKTFGLKNKNKSKKVQQFINRVEKSVKNSGDGLDAAKAKELKKEAKLAKKIQEEEMRLLFNEAIANQFGVKKSKAQRNAANLGLTEANQDVADFLDNLSSSEDESESEDEHLYQPAAATEEEDNAPAGGIEVFREKTIEDIIEEQRAKLAAEGKKGTPITEVSFAKWKAEKQARKQAEAEAKLKTESLKKKGGKGLSVLSGKELFNYNASLFIDDDSAFDTSNDKKLNEEMVALQEKEAKIMEEETARAQAEQMRLLEAQRIEQEVRNYKDDERKKAAEASDRVTFEFNGVVINQIVFEEDETEDLDLFPNDPFGVPSDKDIIEFMKKLRATFAANQAAEQEQDDEWEQNIDQLNDDLKSTAIVA